MEVTDPFYVLRFCVLGFQLVVEGVRPRVNGRCIGALQTQGIRNGNLADELTLFRIAMAAAGASGIF